MLKPKRRPYRPSIDRLETRRIQINLIEQRGFNPPVVTMHGPWNSPDWRERNLFLHEAIVVRDRLNELLPQEAAMKGVSDDK
nr:hypothetical protein [uncultured Cohaesibacter sp.]